MASQILGCRNVSRDQSQGVKVMCQGIFQGIFLDFQNQWAATWLVLDVHQQQDPHPGDDLPHGHRPVALDQLLAASDADVGKLGLTASCDSFGQPWMVDSWMVEVTTVTFTIAIGAIIQ